MAEHLSVHDHVDAPAGYQELLDRGSMSVGLYQLAAGSEDPQSPHAENEIYYILSGRAKLRVADEVVSVNPGDLVFVGRETDHEFFDIQEALATLVVFAPAEGSLES